MQNALSSSISMKPVDWYCEEFIYKSLTRFLKENGYKIHRDNFKKEAERTGRIITASKFFKKEVIEVKGFSDYAASASANAVPTKSTNVKSWFIEALFNSFTNFSLTDNAEVAMALPNFGKYQAIIKHLHDYFLVNDLYFRLYLINEDGSVEISNLNSKYIKPTEVHA